MGLRMAAPAGVLTKFYEALMEPKTEKKETKVLSTREIFGESKLVLIEHQDAIYRLMITRQGKLILNK